MIAKKTGRLTTPSSGFGAVNFNIPAASGFDNLFTYLSYGYQINGYSDCASGSYANCHDITGFNQLYAQLVSAWQSANLSTAVQNVASNSATSNNGSTAAGQVYNPQMAVSVTGGRNTNPIVGDQFIVKITGGCPNCTVTVTRNGAWGIIGQTDANGNFTLNGSFTPDLVGVQAETWGVNGVNAGTWNFTVVAASQTNTNTQTSSQQTQTQNQTTNTTTQSNTQTDTTGQNINTTNNQVGSTSTTNTSPNQTNTTSNQASGTVSNIEGWLQSNPTYVLIGAAAILGFLIFGGKEHER